MVVNRSEAARSVIEGSEHWKRDNTGPLRYQSGQRFNQIFDRSTQLYISARLAAVGIAEGFECANEERLET